MCSRLLLAFLVLMFAGIQNLYAAACEDIWPDRDTSSAVDQPDLPSFTGTSSLSLSTTLSTGDYHYSSSSDSTGDLSVSGPTTRVYINGNLTLGGSADLNPGGNPEDLILIVNGDINFSYSLFGIDVNAIVYATGNVNLNNYVTVTGSVTAAGSVNNPHRIAYDSSAVTNADFGSLCGAGPKLELVSLECGRSDRIIVSFSDATGQEVLNSSTEVVGNYSLVQSGGGSVSITDAELADNGYEVILTLGSSLQEGSAYTLTMNNISDESGNVMASTTDTFYYTATESGIVGAYYNNSILSDPVTDYRTDSTIDDYWGWSTTPFGSGTNGFSIRWRGYFQPGVTGNYQFRTYTDDGLRLWIDDLSGTEEIDNWTDHGGTTDYGASSFSLEAGTRYPIKMEYYNRSAFFETGVVRLDWRLNSGSWYVAPNGISGSGFYTCKEAPEATNGLVVNYRLDGPTWNGSPNEVLDSSGRDVHGNIVNGAVSSLAQVCNGATLDGSNFIRVGDNDELDLSDELTVTAWIKLEQWPSSLASILSKDENYEFHIRNNGAIFWWWNSNAGVRSFDSGSSVISLDAWHHIAVVYADGRQSIYLDGDEVAFTTYSGEILVTNSDPLEIGADQGITDRQWVGQLDEIRVYKQPLSEAEVEEVMAETHPCAAYLDSFQVTAAANASVCAPTAVTLTAQNPDGSTYTGFTGPVDLSTSSNHGNWSVLTGNGSLLPTPDSDDDGAAQYTFVTSDNGSVQLYLSNTHADELTITALENGGSATGSSNTVAFSENAFQIDIVDSWSTDMVAGRDHALRIQALRRPDPSSDCGLFTEYTGNQNLKAWLTRSGQDPAGAAPEITTVSGNQALPDSRPGSDNVTLSFTGGEALLNWVTTDVGQYQFNLEDNSSGLVLDASGNPIAIEGSSQQFTVRPFGFYLTAFGNPAAADASGGSYVKAGESFTLYTIAVGYQASDDLDGDHHPDVGADLSTAASGNIITPAFGSEQGGAAETVVLTSSLNLPATGNDPGLSGTTTVSSFFSGGGPTSLSFAEVGIIEIQAQLSDASYLGADNVTGMIENVGRFYPAYFSVTDNSPQLRDGNGSWSCPFTYQGQAFGFDVEPVIAVQAHNVSGDPTQNYSEDFWNLTVPSHSIDLQWSSLPGGAACDNGGTVAAGCFTENSASVSRSWSGNDDYDGNANLITGTHSLTLNKLNVTPDAGDIPFNPVLDYSVSAAQLTDSDGACYEVSGVCSGYQINGGSGISGTELRWGRAWVDSAVGSVMSPLPITLRLQYWNSASQFQLNEDDDGVTCNGTLAAAGDMLLSNYSGNLSAGETTVSGVSPYPGYHILNLSAPGYQGSTANDGRVQLNWNVDSWLESDIDADNSADDPWGTASFVGPAANQPILFRRESYR